MIPDFNNLVKGSSLSLPPPSLKLRRAGAHGRVGAKATSSLVAHFAYITILLRDAKSFKSVVDKMGVKFIWSKND
jgi:hypothetical protein